MTADKKTAVQGSAAPKAKGKSKPATYLAIGSTLFAAFSNIKKVRSARGEGDTLQFVDAAIRVAAVVTGVALLVRELRHNDDDILTG
ncbi:hypothetical protein [Actinacidiphila acididurans]|uniref:DUF4235 domain-containing protein n=1 Tax=Actinacidiphila acididurans TaxID=2784346 RepID=A0ABS2TNN2_9ACTN|nr:hypothetical protein [Actinacidiphila acididurans]MBM9503840.1 hypothetical protein [Actinacidiphila acididurans]